MMREFVVTDMVRLKGVLKYGFIVAVNPIMVSWVGNDAAEEVDPETILHAVEPLQALWQDVPAYRHWQGSLTPEELADLLLNVIEDAKHRNIKFAEIVDAAYKLLPERK